MRQQNVINHSRYFRDKRKRAWKEKGKAEECHFIFPADWQTTGGGLALAQCTIQEFSSLQRRQTNPKIRPTQRDKKALETLSFFPLNFFSFFEALYNKKLSSSNVLKACTDFLFYYQIPSWSMTFFNCSKSWHDFFYLSPFIAYYCHNGYLIGCQTFNWFNVHV